MPIKTLHGDEEGFHVVWYWYQPQEEAYQLKYGDELLLTLTENKTQLLKLCDRLNELLPVNVASNPSH